MGNTTGSVVNVSAIPYFENVFPFMADYDYNGESATQAIYNNEWAPYRSQYGATTALADLDFFCVYLSNAQCADYQSKFWQDQFSSLYALDTIGMSYYNAGQITLRHPMSHGLQSGLQLYVVEVHGFWIGCGAQHGVYRAILVQQHSEHLETLTQSRRV